MELSTKIQHNPEEGYRQALKEAILCMDSCMEAKALKDLGTMRLQKGKISKDPAEFDKAAALYAAALLRCTDPDMGQTLEHCIGYMEKVSRQLLQGYTPQFQLPNDYMSTANNDTLRVAARNNLVKIVQKSQPPTEETYMEMLVAAIENRDMFMELEVLKSLGDFYLQKGRRILYDHHSSQLFSKATTMYSTALERCDKSDTDMAQTLHNRLSYTERVREALKKYSEHLKEGDSSLARADLDSAEKYFAAALKIVHVIDPTAQQYQREVEPLCKLGDVYSKRGQQTGDGGDFVKAAALYNAAIARSEDQVLNEMKKKQLKEMRDQIKLEMKTIDLQQLDPYVYDEDDPCVREIEAKRAQAVRHLFENIAQQRKEFISLLVEECIGLMGPPPCKYALIGLGSQATGLVTPYSDLEFAILVEEESEECLVYFRNLTNYLHLKVVNLGETILPALGIKSLNDFYSEDPLENWYYDSVTPHGFAFDGSMPKASKTPLGRQGTVDEPPSELICTPENMVSKLEKDFMQYLNKEYHLATILRNPCLIRGDQDLIDTYIATTGKKLKADGGTMAQQLAQETMTENRKTYNYSNDTDTARLIDVKRELYRFAAVAVDFLALSSGIIPTTVWQTIEDMERKQAISPNNAHHLTVLTSISAELRLRTYIANGGQKETLSAMASMETMLQGPQTTNEEVQTRALKPVFHLSNNRQLFRHFYTASPLKRLLFDLKRLLFEKKPIFNPISFDLYDSSPTVRGKMYLQLCKYNLAIGYYKKALERDDVIDMEKIDLLSCMGAVLLNMGNGHEARGYFEQALQMCKSIYGETTAHPDIARLLHNLAHTWGDDRKAINYHKQALQMYKSIYGQTTAHPFIAMSLNNLGTTWSNLGDCKKAISYYEQGLQMSKRIYGQTSAHPIIAMSLNNLGTTWSNLGDCKKAISYYEQGTADVQECLWSDYRTSWHCRVT
uniref:Protein-PII uridylyltransferase N-terminal domain-containing protein n=1 Tax=Branchiostoma floridae TaxID=7739 RepID=C3YHX3_BRAFL|eukprot:XP_002604099.1 hypothetical protein BRAFLDRAFT_71612 [Branchiostoma floridae]